MLYSLRRSNVEIQFQNVNPATFKGVRGGGKEIITLTPAPPPPQKKIGGAFARMHRPNF